MEFRIEWHRAFTFHSSKGLVIGRLDRYDWRKEVLTVSEPIPKPQTADLDADLNAAIDACGQ
jgi:hypothetical protein